jgi:predicted Rossmann fold nucleotide-binding protein DprA/Smf involved in DNA uptake
MFTNNLSPVLSPNSQAILLLCASFGQNRQADPQPLTVTEYSNLVKWLVDHDMKPADLLARNGKSRLQEIPPEKLDYQRLFALLERGAMLAFAVENWTNQGIWILTRSDANYPKRLKKHLKHSAPPILYGVGNQALLNRGGLAIVGSREVDPAGLEYTQKVAQISAHQGIQVVSGGDKGVDRAAMLAAVEVGGTTVGMLAHPLSKEAVFSAYRSAIQDGRLTLVSAYDPNAGFNVGNAMGRNKYIYALADYALVVSSALGSGGTWAGAIEALQKIQTVPLFVRIQENVPEGNHELLKKGAIPFPDLTGNESLWKLLSESVSQTKSELVSDEKNAQQSNADQLELIVTTVSQETPPLPSQETQVPESKVDEAAIAKRVAKHIAPEPKLANIKTISDSPIFAPKNIYEAVLPFILKQLEQPKDIGEIVTVLDVKQGQMQDWLKKAVEQGLITKKTKPVRYEINYQAVGQLSLLDE